MTERASEGPRVAHRHVRPDAARCRGLPRAFRDSHVKPSGPAANLDQMHVPDSDPDAYRLAYEEARRGLDEQEHAAGELRGRAGGIIAGAAVATSFFGGQAVGGTGLGLMGWIAIACFVVLGVVIVMILWPRDRWEVGLSPARLVTTYIEPAEGAPVPLAVIHRDLALHMGGSANRNRRELQVLTVALRVAAVLLVAEMLAWVVALLDHP